MSWSSQLRVLGIGGLWLAVQTGCGGTPEVATGNHPANGGTDTGGAGVTSIAGTGGGIVFNMGGQGNENAGGAPPDMPTKFVCGNGMLEPGEFCDDGNTKDGDGCSGDCTMVDPNFDCSVEGQACVQVVICGDGVLEGAEMCDDFNTVDKDGCSADCSTVEDGFVCVRPGKPCVAGSVCCN